ncbi:MAG: methyltransferase domain-containing protein [Bacteroidetes bacterium]|jgi:SAM-dependent methyltransferase|nr:methyltransferase domain-containing protein [Bacteroidota bacterium]
MNEPATNISPTELLRPQQPHDDWPIDRLAGAYSFDQTSKRERVFCNMVLGELRRHPRPVTLLDIGCGSGMGETPFRYDYVRALSRAADRMLGIEPDTSVSPPGGIVEDIERCTLEQSALPDASVDVAYAYFVVEHVVDPVGFLSALRRILKPGGAFFLMTPNGRHYFVRLAKLLKRLGLDEWLLRRIRPDEMVEEYHYPVVYRMNRPSDIARAARQAGLEPPAVATFECRKWGREYFPGPTRLLWHGLMLKRRLIHNPRCLGNLVVCIRKPPKPLDNARMRS